MDVIGDSGRSTSRNIIDIIQKAIFSVLHDWEIKTRTRIKDDARGTVEYVSFDIGYGIKEDAIKEGSIVFAGPVDQRLVVKIETNYYEHIESLYNDAGYNILKSRRYFLHHKERKH